MTEAGTGRRGWRSGTVRFGILGAGRGAGPALIQPARQTPGVEVEAVASRTLEKAEAFARAQGLPRAYGSYDALLADPAVDAVYVALPTGLHAAWVERALAAGKHVLCEKPLAANATEAARMAASARAHRRVLQEGMQTRYSNRLHRQRQIVADGTIGRVQRVDACFRVPRLPLTPGDFRLHFELGGGAGLDLGCYAIACTRYLLGEEPAVGRVRCRRIAPGVDRWMHATLRFPSGARGTAECGFRGWYLPKIGVRVTGDRGWVRWEKAGLAWRAGGREVKEACAPDWPQQRQLEAFLRSCRGEPSEALSLDDSVATASVIDAMYLGAGLPLRGVRAS